MQKDVHQITLTQKKEVVVTGVEGVLSFSETKIALSLVGGGKLFVAGSGLKISGFSKENAEQVKSSLDNAVSALELMLRGNTDMAMNKFNQR